MSWNFRSKVFWVLGNHLIRNMLLCFYHLINPIQNGGGQKSPTCQFFPRDFYKCRDPLKFLTFSFNLFTTLMWNFKGMAIASPKLLNLNQYHPTKKWFFWSNPYKIEVMITSLIEMLELPNFGHATTLAVWFESHDKIWLTLKL